jgi:hypothetical protein
MQSVPTATVFLSFGDISISRQTVWFLQRCWKSRVSTYSKPDFSPVADTFRVRIRIAKHLTNGNNGFRCEIAFEDEQTCSWTHHVRTNKASAQLACAEANSKGDLDPRVAVEVRCAVREEWNCCWLHVCTVVGDCYWLRFKWHILSDCVTRHWCHTVNS